MRPKVRLPAVVGCSPKSARELQGIGERGQRDRNNKSASNHATATSWWRAEKKVRNPKHLRFPESCGPRTLTLTSTTMGPIARARSRHLPQPVPRVPSHASNFDTFEDQLEHLAQL